MHEKMWTWGWSERGAGSFVASTLLHTARLETADYGKWHLFIDDHYEGMYLGGYKEACEYAERAVVEKTRTVLAQAATVLVLSGEVERYANILHDIGAAQAATQPKQGEGETQ